MYVWLFQFFCTVPNSPNTMLTKTKNRSQKGLRAKEQTETSKGNKKLLETTRSLAKLMGSSRE